MRVQERHESQLPCPCAGLHADQSQERVSSSVEHTMSVVTIETGQWSQNANNFRNNATEETSEGNPNIGIRAQKSIGFGMRCVDYVLAEHVVKKKSNSSKMHQRNVESSLSLDDWRFQHYRVVGRKGSTRTRQRRRKDRQVGAMETEVEWERQST